MASLDEVRGRAFTLLTSADNTIPVPPEGDVDSAILPGGEFSVFFQGHLTRANRLASDFVAIADNLPGPDGLDAVLSAAFAALGTENSELVKYALMVFIAQHPSGRQLPVPPLDQRSPDKVRPSNPDVARDGLRALVGLVGEQQLDYFREDSAVNEHHPKWHSVYNTGGDIQTHKTRDRQGELFWFMHQQMLARYDHDRLAFTLPPALPLADYRAPIAEGYDPHSPRYSARPANYTLQDLPGYSLAAHELRRDRLTDAATTGLLHVGTNTVPVTTERLLDTMECNVSSVDGPGRDPLSFYGSLHTRGHILFGLQPGPLHGVMYDMSTSMRDPVFYRWHRHLDDIEYRWQQRVPPNDLSQSAATVLIRPQDIILSFMRGLPADPATFGRDTFGGAHWDDPPSSFAIATDTLVTTMKERTIGTGTTTVKKVYLDFDDFCYFLRVENRLAVAQDVTIRIFVVATEWIENRRMWIEMDKFVQRLAPNERAVLFRPSTLASVVRKPARRPTDPPPDPSLPDIEYCDCGWPYHLLLPRGTVAGMPMRLLVMATDFQRDLADTDKKCGSMSFCGTRDRLYPDRRPMGYPFDAPFPGSIAETFSNKPHLALRDLTIRHV
jgi:hypothetical protein